uniref:hypothetical protein n=1 Tax=uncultured Erythrobacter sp. TaxID=263913 RepID=UPI00262E685B|nr:hypothetical protein [uncultured Erythrobacter sp.]
MSKLPEFVKSGERARLFPILSQSSVEGRTLSIFLATLVRVRPFAERVLGQLGRKVGAWTTIDAVVTISNQFSLAPSHHPVSVNIPKQVELFHISWMRVLTEAYLLLNEGVDDADQEYILNEFKRFISHESAGVESFTQMPAGWSDMVKTIQVGGQVLAKPGKEIVQAWHQECQDLSLIFSRQIDAGVTQKLSRAQVADPNLRVEKDFERLRREHTLVVELEVPDAADSVKVCADLGRRTISVSMSLGAPTDKKGNHARLNWLLRQLPKIEGDEVFIRAQWPGTSPWTQIALNKALEKPEFLFADKGRMVLLGFEVVRVTDLGQRFAQRQTIIKELEESVPEFWKGIGQNLRKWVKPAPKVKADRSEPEAVSPTAISDEE